jgi:type I restriction enzyme S subunit
LLLKPNDFAYNKSATKEYPEGFLALYSGDKLAAVPNSIFTCFRIKGDSPAPRYLNYLFLGNLHGQWLRNFIQVGARAHGSLSINDSDLLALPVPLPKGKSSLAEQQNIADCLSSLDELIAAQARKVDALKTHKKGLMQQLFPREGETQPRLRFPEFRGAGDWESKLLSDLVKSFKTGKLDANAMVEGGQYRFYTCAKNYYQIDNFAFDGEALLVAGNGAHLGYIHHYIGKFNAYQRTYVLQEFKANVVFLRCLLDRFLPARILFEKKDGNTPYIVLATLTEMPLMIPTDPEEQKCIADCLTSLDTLITAATQELETLKTHKKGLMQQLFPSAKAAEV